MLNAGKGAELDTETNKVRRILAGGIAILALVLAGCDREPAVVWSAHAASPDGRWSANAHTDQWAGFGNNYVATTVELQQSSQKAERSNVILAMTNASAYPSGSTAVKMRWASNTSLDIAYPDSATLDFQAVLASRIAIIAHPYTAGKRPEQ